MRRHSRLLPILLILAGCTARSAGLPSLSANGAAAIDRMFQSAVDQREIPGVVAAVVNKDRILYLKAFGKQDVAGGIPMSTGTVYVRRAPPRVTASAAGTSSGITHRRTPASSAASMTCPIPDPGPGTVTLNAGSPCSVLDRETPPASSPVS